MDVQKHNLVGIELLRIIFSWGGTDIIRAHQTVYPADCTVVFRRLSDP